MTSNRQTDRQTATIMVKGKQYYPNRAYDPPVQAHVVICWCKKQENSIKVRNKLKNCVTNFSHRAEKSEFHPQTIILHFQKHQFGLIRLVQRYSLKIDRLIIFADIAPAPRIYWHFDLYSI